MVNTTCSVYGCLSTSRSGDKNLKFHKFPRGARAQSWITACQRPDLQNKNSRQLGNMHVCSLHFESWMYKKKQLTSAVVPILNLPPPIAQNEAENIQAVEFAKSDAMASPVRALVASTIDRAPAPKKKKGRPMSVAEWHAFDRIFQKSLGQVTSQQSKNVVLNIHKHFLKRKQIPSTWEFRVGLNLTAHVAEMTGLTEMVVQEIISGQESGSKSQAVNDQGPNEEPEAPVNIKLEVEDDFSEHEDDVLVQLENRKRLQEKDPIAIDTKKMKVELDQINPGVEAQYETMVHPTQQQQEESQSQGLVVAPPQAKGPQPHQPQPETIPDQSVMIPEFFMCAVVRNQTEILSILKRQVLLQDPDPELLTFLRFLGSKMLRFPKRKREELQDRITELILLE